MGKIVAIGGGECGRPGTSYETKEIDLEIISLTRKEKPNFLLIALGNSNPDMYFNTLGTIYKDYGCNVEELKKNDLKDYDVLKSKMDWADIIYVGGGNTLKLMNIFRKYKIDVLLMNAYKDDKVLCGLSAGAICWCSYGNSDSRKNPYTNKTIIRVKGLDFVHILLCPHYDAEGYRAETLKNMMKRTYTISALALDNCVAIEIIQDKFRIITSKCDANATKFYWKNGKYINQKIEKNTFFDMDMLYKR